MHIALFYTMPTTQHTVSTQHYTLLVFINTSKFVAFICFSNVYQFSPESTLFLALAIKNMIISSHWWLQSCTIMLFDTCRLCQGLRWLNFYKTMKKYPKLMEMADNKGDLTATTVWDQYQVTFSEEGTNRRRTEQQAFAWWLDLLQDLEGKQIVFCSRN